MTSVTDSIQRNLYSPSNLETQNNPVTVYGDAKNPRAPLASNIKSVDDVGVKYLEFNAENQELVLRMPDRYKVLKIKETRVRSAVLVGTRNSIWKQLQDFGNSFDDGPYHMGSRDNKVIIQNDNINSPIIRVFTYAGGSGNLISFSVGESKQKKGADAGKVTEIDPETGELKTSYFQVAKKDSVNIDAIVEWPNQRDVVDGMDRPEGVYEDKLRRSSGYGKDIDPEWQNPIPENMTEDEFRAYLDSLPTSQSTTPDKSDSQAYRGVYKVPADAPIYQAEKDFTSVEEGVNAISNDPDITQEEFFDWLNNVATPIFNKIKSYNGDNLPDDFSDTTKSFNSLGTLTIKRTFKVRYVNQKPSNWGHGFQEQESILSSPSLSNEVFDERWLRGLSYLTTASEISDLQKNADNTYNFVKMVTKEVPINGARILAAYDPVNFNIQMANDIREEVGDYVKGTASIIGDPTLESSVNVQIQNVSKMYSGVWYVKKVHHKMEPGQGYTCDIEFKLREPIRKVVTVETNLYTRKWLETASEKAKAAIASGKAFYIENLRADLDELFNSKPGYSFLLTTDGEEAKVYETDQNFSADVPDGKIPNTDGEVINLGNKQ